MAQQQAIAIEIKGFAEFQKALAGGSAVAERELERALFTSALAVEGKAKEYAPVKTGALRRSITHVVERQRAIVGTNLHYAPHLEFGTKAHGPRTAPFLVFQIGGKWIRTKHVRGIAPRRFFGRAVDASRASVSAAFQKAIDALFTFLTR